ncbi:DUF421 domain-containing protein [Chryseobacterium sp. Leaf180]|uniref:DUF421 domain-containing protein n=1 Tax=Chryseobacterium sp. Leaf180 TaxID=1736289 RepID=UPI0009EAD836|nr:YetF domain-containing protein [Chryseobacterium sp. Leaf180]
MLYILTSDFSWQQFFFGSEDISFLIEIVLRTLIMFVTIIFGLRVLGKRGVKQLSIFELVVIVGLGSAAGDPMFYKEVGIVSSIMVFCVIIASYSLLTFLLAKFKKFEIILEGKPTCLISNGEFAITNFKKENLGNDEFFSELRLKGISHLGQIETAIEETSGDISVFYFKDEDVKFGLPIMIDSLKNHTRIFEKDTHYSCSFCGFTEKKDHGDNFICNKCSNSSWILSKNNLRVT